MIYFYIAIGAWIISAACSVAAVYFGKLGFTRWLGFPAAVVGYGSLLYFISLIVDYSEYLGQVVNMIIRSI